MGKAGDAPYVTVQFSAHAALAPLGFSVGVNLAGMEFGRNYPGVAGADYFVPTHDEVDYYLGKGIRTIRLPFQWERMQPALSGPLDPVYLRNVQDFANYAASRGMSVILDLHNFGEYRGHKLGDGTLTNDQFADFWKRLATTFAPDGGVHFAYDIMNEPHDMPAHSAWPSAAQAAIDAIRTVDAAALIYVEGDEWSSAYRWVANNPTLQTLKDPSSRLVFSAHAYADRNNSGTHFTWSDEVKAGDQLDVGTALSTSILVKRLTPFVTWLHIHGLHGQIGVLGIGNNDANWLTALDTGYAYLQANGVPVTQWAGGPAWGSYEQSVEPGPWLTGYQASPIADAAQMAVMTKYSLAAQPSVYFLTGPRTGSPKVPSGNFTIAYRGSLASATTRLPRTTVALAGPSSTRIRHASFRDVQSDGYLPLIPHPQPRITPLGGKQ